MSGTLRGYTAYIFIMDKYPRAVFSKGVEQDRAWFHVLVKKRKDEVLEARQEAKKRAKEIRAMHVSHIESKLAIAECHTRSPRRDNTDIYIYVYMHRN